MIKKRLIKPTKVRKIQGTFAFLEHRFLRQGFFEHLTQHELLLYLFLVLALPDHAVIRRQPPAPGDTRRGGEPVAIFDLLRHFLPPQERLENAS